jgi:hypothetical protein
MILVIALLVGLTLAGIVFVLGPRMAEGRVIFRAEPDAPAAFGYHMAWLALRARDTASALDALGLEVCEPCNWNSGIGTVYDQKLGQNHVYVTPPVNGWTFVVGLPLPHPAGRGYVDKLTPLLVALGGRFIEVQYFFAYPPIDLFAWARVLDGRLVRAFAAGDEGIVWNKGKTTKEERALGLKLFELRGVKGRRGDAGGEMILHPTEDHVMRLAHRWSQDPTRLEGLPPSAAPGYIAIAPASWRAERQRKTA